MCTLHHGSSNLSVKRYTCIFLPRWVAFYLYVIFILYIFYCRFGYLDSRFVRRVGRFVYSSPTLSILCTFPLSVQISDGGISHRIRHGCLEPTEYWPFSYHDFTVIAAWIINHTPSKVWDKITQSLPNFNGVYSTLYDGCNYLTMMGLKMIHDSKRGQWIVYRNGSEIKYMKYPWKLLVRLNFVLRFNGFHICFMENFKSRLWW